jgi:hypothetical protein
VRTLRTTLALLSTAVALLVAAPSALAVNQAIYKECQRGTITGKYSQKDFADALRGIGTDLLEYTNCQDVIRRAQLAAAGGGPAGSGGGGAGGGITGGGTLVPAGGGGGGTAAQLLASASPAERKAVSDAIGSKVGGAPVMIGGRRVSPDVAGISPAGAANVLPAPLIVVLVLLGLTLLLALGVAARTRLHPATEGLRARVRARRDRSS